jgi:hypothetical protein
MDDLNKSERLLSVNWEDGMLIKASHFLDQESYFENLSRWIVEHGMHLPGLTGQSIHHTSSLEMRIDHDGQKWLVLVSRCYALSACGRIIHVDSQLDNAVKSAPISDHGGGAAPVYIHVRPDKLGTGRPSSGDEPTRFTHRSMHYDLIVGDLKGVDPADCVKIGEVVFGDGRPTLNPDYIPPCMVLNAHPLLAEQCRRLFGLLTLTQQGAVTGFQAFVIISQDQPGKFGMEHRWFQEMLGGLAIQLGGMLRTHPQPELPLAPFALFMFYQQVFGIVDAMLETYREATLTIKKKFADNESYKRFSEGLKEFLGSRYNHHELGPQTARLIRLMNDFVEFVNLVRNLAGALPQVGLVMNYRNREYRLQPFSSVVSHIERDSVTVKIEGLGSSASRDLLVGLNRELFSGVDYRYIMVKIGINENDIPGRMDPVYVDAETAGNNLILKPMDDLANFSITSLNLNFRGNFNPQDLKSIPNDMVNVYIY